MLDINVKKLKKNAFRITKERGLTASRIRVPGGHLNVKYFENIYGVIDENIYQLHHFFAVY